MDDNKGVIDPESVLMSVAATPEPAETAEPEIEAGSWFTKIRSFGTKVHNWMVGIGDVVSNFIGLQESAFQDVMNEMSYEEWQAAMETHRKREEADERYRAQGGWAEEGSVGPVPPLKKEIHIPEVDSLVDKGLLEFEPEHEVRDPPSEFQVQSHLNSSSDGGSDNGMGTESGTVGESMANRDVESGRGAVELHKIPTQKP